MNPRRALPSLLAVLTALGASACGGAGRTTADVAGDPPAQPARTQPPAPPRPGHFSVHVMRPTVLRARPGGTPVARVQPRTGFGSPTVLAVVAERGAWYGVLSPALPNGRIGWIPIHAALVPYANDFRVVASLHRREVVVKEGGRVVLRFPIAVGSASTPTPTGRFAVTDKLLTHDPASPYGCCILALSAHQPNTPQGWGGGDRIAIHATNLPESIGTAASLGCLRAPEDAMRRAVRLVPLGTLVTIRA